MSRRFASVGLMRRDGSRHSSGGKRILVDLATAGTFARASVATWEVESGVVQSWASGERRMVPTGMAFEGARTNELPYGADLTDAAWDKSGGAAVGDATNDPAGALEADK